MSLAGGASPGAGLSPLVLTQPGSLLVDREAELSQLHQRLVSVRRGQRQVVFITGEAGIGKTTVVATFVQQARQMYDVWVSHGQCIDLYGAGEPYLPLLDALGRLGRCPHGAPVVALLKQQAPSWVLQLPAVVPEEEFDSVQQRAIGATREQMLRELAEAVEPLTAEHPLILVAAGTVLRGWALAEQGELATGLAQIQRGTHAYRETGTALGWSNYLVHLAEVFARGGKRAAGLQTLEEAQNIVAHSQERYWEAELYRVKADLLVAHGSSRQTNEEVETALHHALAVARQQQAKVLELQVSMRLSRLWQRQGKLEEARQLLAPIYAWFAERFDTVDLQEAQTLLQALR